MGRVRQGDVEFIVVAHKDRLARFGFDLISWLCEQDGTKIVVLNQDGLSPKRELVEDIQDNCSCLQLPTLRTQKVQVCNQKRSGFIQVLNWKKIGKNGWLLVVIVSIKQ